LRYVQSGVDSGATLVAGGDRVGDRGFYIQPTVFADAKVIGSASIYQTKPHPSISISLQWRKVHAGRNEDRSGGDIRAGANHSQVQVHTTHDLLLTTQSRRAIMAFE
jgi:hypothetical protein